MSIALRCVLDCEASPRSDLCLKSRTERLRNDLVKGDGITAANGDIWNAMTVRNWKNPGIGFARQDGAQQRIIIGFDPETFVQVRRRAKAAGTSFAEQVRLLVEFGLETARADETAEGRRPRALDDNRSDQFSEISDLS